MSDTRAQKLPVWLESLEIWQRFTAEYCCCHMVQKLLLLASNEAKYWKFMSYHYRMRRRRQRWKWYIPALLAIWALVSFFHQTDDELGSGDLEHVQRVVDGDTLVLSTGERVRLIGVHTPETKHPNKTVDRADLEN